MRAMSKRNKRSRAATRPKKRASARRRPQRRREPDLIERIADALDDGRTARPARAGQHVPRGGRSPVATTRSTPIPTGRRANSSSTRFLDAPLPETSALLAAVAALSRDDVLRRRVSHEIADRAHALPSWLAELSRATAAPEAVEVTHPLGDADDVLVSVTLPDGHALTAVVLIEHNLGLDREGRLRRVRSARRARRHDPGRPRQRAGHGRRAALPGRREGADRRGRRAGRDGPSRRWRPRPGRCAARSSSGWSRCCRTVGRATSAASGPTRRPTTWPGGSARRGSPQASTIPATCCRRCSGSAPATARAIRCAGARRPWRSCCSTGSRARSWRTSRSWPTLRTCCGRSSGSATTSAASGPG